MNCKHERKCSTQLSRCAPITLVHEVARVVPASCCATTFALSAAHAFKFKKTNVRSSGESDDDNDKRPSPRFGGEPSRHERSRGCRSSRQGQSGRVCEDLLAIGAGFFYIPGTDTCIKLGGYLRVDTTFNGDIYDGPAWNGDLGQQNRYRDYFAARSRMALTIDTRTATEYGVVRTFGQADFQFSTLGGSTVNPNSINATLAGCRHEPA